MHFPFYKVSEVEVFLLLESIDCKNSFDFEKIPPLLLSSAELEIFKPVTYIIYLTLKTTLSRYICLKGQCHENHFKNTRVQKHIYSNGKLQVVVYFLKNSNVSVKKLKTDVISLC